MAQPPVLTGAVACGRDKKGEREEKTHGKRERPAQLHLWEKREEARSRSG
jgi:hypothetical protein